MPIQDPFEAAEWLDIDSLKRLVDHTNYHSTRDLAGQTIFARLVRHLLEDRDGLSVENYEEIFKFLHDVGASTSELANVLPSPPIPTHNTEQLTQIYGIFGEEFTTEQHNITASDDDESSPPAHTLPEVVAMGSSGLFFC